MAKKVTKNVHINVTSNVKGITGKAGAGADKLKGKLDGAKGSAGKLGGAMKGLGARFLAFAKHPATLVAAAVAGIVTGLKAALNVAEGFSKSMSRLSAISGATGDDLNKLKENAENLGKSTQFTAAQVADAQTELAKMGFTTTGILNATSGALDLAVSSGIEMADAAEIMAATMNGFGMETSEAGRITDVMAKSFVTSALDAEKFRESMKLVAPAAKNMKVSLEQSTAAIAVLADQGIAGSMAGTSLRRVLAELSAKTGKDFRQSLDIYAERLENVTSTSGKMAIATEAVGMRNKDVLLSLIANRDKLDELTVSYQNAGGAAKGMVTTMEENLSGDKKKMRSALEGLGITISETLGLEKAMRFVTQKFTGFVGSIDKFFGTMGLKSEKTGIAFNKFGLNIQEGILEMRLAFIKLQRKIADIPLIGRVIDKKNLDESEKSIQESLDKITSKYEAYGKRREDIQTEIDNYGVTTDVTSEGDTAPSTTALPTDEFVEGEAEGDGESSKLADRMRYLEKLKKAEQDFEDETHLAKMERARARAVEEADLLGASEEQMQTIRDSFQARIDAARQKDVDDHHKANQEKINKELENLDLMARIFGEESKLGKLALIAKAQMSKIEMKIDGEVTMSKMLKATAEAGVDYFKGIGKAASAAPFPLNVPLVAGHIATALPLFMQLKSVFKKNKATAGLSGASEIQTPSASLSGGGNTVTAPEFNVVGQASAGENMIADTIASANQKPIRTYVVSTDVSNSQELERKAEGTASLG
jgi:hypothetical protein